MPQTWFNRFVQNASNGLTLYRRKSWKNSLPGWLPHGHRFFTFNQFLFAIPILCLLLSGCVSQRDIEKQSQKVARDWCMVIRGSQVIPVYPLTEDLVPGDVFLVQQTHDEEVKHYRDKGYLPLDHHLLRLRPNTYSNFYFGSHGVGNGLDVPYVWTFPDPPRPTNSVTPVPLASFPTYRFQVTRSGGFNLALPIQGVPVALNFLNASSAKGDVVLGSATTYGVDDWSLAEVVYTWAAKNREKLAVLGPSSGRTNFLRVVNRVYLIQSASVSISSDSAGGAAGSAGADKPVNLFQPQTGNALTNQLIVQSNLSASVSSAAVPGGSAKLTWASSRGVSLDERFPRPLVVGYVGYDIPILEGGELGLYSSTLRKLSGGDVSATHKPVSWGADPNTAIIEDYLASQAQNRQKVIEWLRGKNYPFNEMLTYFLHSKEFASLRKQFVTESLKMNP